MTMPESALDELVAKQAITDVLHRYCRGIDRRDWELVRSSYHPDAYDDHAIYRGERDGLIEFFKDFLTSNCAATRHSLSNILINVDGDTAGAESYVHAWHRMLPEPGAEDSPAKNLIMGARYVDRLERRDGEWRLANRLVVSDWIRVEMNDGESFDLGPDALWSRADRDDVSYSVLPSGNLIEA
jgi:SnoaL-like domain